MMRETTPKLAISLGILVSGYGDTALYIDY